MTSRTRTLVLAALLLAREPTSAGAEPKAIPEADSPALSAANAAAPDSSLLEFHGFQAGARLQDLQAIVRRFDGSTLRCDRAKADPRVRECRAVVKAQQLGGAVNLWISTVDSVASVITLASTGGVDQLTEWRQSLERRYGRVDASVQGSQWMMQWVRRGRMLRLTWRVDR